MIHVQSQHDSQKVIQSLSCFQSIAVGRAIACWAIEITVGTKDQIASVVTVRLPFQNDQLAAFDNFARSVACDGDSSNSIELVRSI